MHYDVGVAHLARPAGCPWPLPVDGDNDDEFTESVALFADLPSLALEEVFWHHLVGEAWRAAAVALADQKNEDDDVIDAEVLRAWLALAYAPLRGSPEFCRVARRLLAGWAEMANAHFGVRALVWRGVSPAPRPGGGSTTHVVGARRAGKTTAAVRLARVLVRRVRHVVCVVANDGDLRQVFADLGIVEYEAAHVDNGCGFDAADVVGMWQAIGPLVRAYAREGVLVLVDDLYWCTDRGCALIDEIANLGVHLVVTSQDMLRPHTDLCADRLVWLCRRRDPRIWHSAESFSCMTRIGRDRVIAAYDAYAHDDNARVALVAQRRCDGAWDLQIMPRTAQSPDP